MSDLHAYGHQGPCINGRTETLHETISPFGETVDFAAEKFIFDAVQFRAQAFVYSGDEMLREGSELHDYGRFGGSIDEAIGDAEKWRAKLGDAVIIKVVAYLVSQPAFYSDEAPFYLGEVKIYHILPRWGWKWEDGKSVDVCDLTKKTTEYQVWQNGERGQDHAEVQRLIVELPQQDIAADRRRKRDDAA